MKNLFFIGLMSIMLCNVGCKKESSNSYEASKTSYEEKCPNCGNVGYHPHETVPSMKICNTCGIGF